MKTLGTILSTGLGTVLVLGLLLMVPAGLAPGGTWLWGRGLWAVGVGAVLQMTGTALVYRFNPKSVEARTLAVVPGRDRGQPVADVIVTAVIGAFMPALLLFTPVDVFWLHLLPAPPLPVAQAGAAASVLGLGLMTLVLIQNEFAAPNVQDQSERGQTLVDTGAYAIVRHPFYTGGLFLIAGLTLWLGSYAALIGSLCLLAPLGVRIAVEERYLVEHLDGYDAYRRRVRSRMVPLVF